MRDLGEASPGKIKFGAVIPAIFLLIVLCAIARLALNRPVSFDGAMNLQVAQSLVEGKGYVREYGGARPFPREVQTNVPFVLPAAAVFGMFGVGLVQSQIVNFMYMIALLALVIFIASRFHGYAAGLYAALALVAVPGFYKIGMNGWGELVALFWWLAGTWLLLRERPGPCASFSIAAGSACLGLAIATKTVMFIGVGATGLVFTIWMLGQGWRTPRRAATELVMAAVFLVLPLALVELWRFSAVGGLQPYLAWWSDQSAAITWQTGVFDAKHTQETSKLASHFRTLVDDTGLPTLLLALWLLVPLATTCVVLASNPVRTAFHRLWFSTTLMVVVYLVWWLMITPDTHVRLRRIEIGLILAQGLWLFCWGWYAGKTGRSRGRIAIAALGALVFAMATGLFVNDAIVGMRKSWNPDIARFHRLVDKVEDLPPGAKLFGKGFLSSPVLALYAERDLDDIDFYTFDDLAKIGTGYLVADPPSVKARRFAPELRRYPHEAVVNDLGYQVYRLDFRSTNNPFSKRDMNSDQVPSAVDFTARRYPLVFGLHGPSREGWRWARTDAEILLRYAGQQAVELRVHNPQATYAKLGPLVLSVSLDGCSLGDREGVPGGSVELRFAIPTRCTLIKGRNARLQILANNMLSPVPADRRQFSYVLLAAGFVH